MKHFAALLLLLFLGLGLSSCSSEPKNSKDLLTGTVWGLSDLSYRGGNSSTTIAIRVTFLRKGQVLLDVGFGKLVEESNNGGTKKYKRSNSVSVTSTYTYRNGVVHFNRPQLSADNGSIIQGTEAELILGQIATDAVLSMEQGTMVFYPTDAKKTFVLTRQS